MALDNLWDVLSCDPTIENPFRLDNHNRALFAVAMAPTKLYLNGVPDPLLSYPFLQRLANLRRFRRYSVTNSQGSLTRRRLILQQKRS